MDRLTDTHLRYDHVSDAFAVGLHGEKIVVVSGRDVELDEGASALGVILVRGLDGQHSVSHGCVLSQGEAAILHTHTHRNMKGNHKHSWRDQTKAADTLTSIFSKRGSSLLTSITLMTTLHSVLKAARQNPSGYAAEETETHVCSQNTAYLDR